MTATLQLTRLGKGTLLAKIDIKSAYRILPVHSAADQSLLGTKWQGNVDTRLPFGLQSAPKIFNTVADTLEWCFHQEGIELVDHYLDDFIILVPPDSPECANNLYTTKRVAVMLGIPLAEEKCEGPGTLLTFLGIEVNTIDMTLQNLNEFK